MIRPTYLVICLLLVCFKPGLFAQSSVSDSMSATDRLSDLLRRDRSHELQVAALLAKPPVLRTDFDLSPLPETLPEVPSFEENILPPYPTIPDYLEPSFPESSEESEFSAPLPAVPAEEPVSVEELEDFEFEIVEEPDREEERKDDEEILSELYQKPSANRHLGYYIGGFAGATFPQKGAIRPTLNERVSYNNDNGIAIGLHLGRDFGNMRMEAEYSYLGFEGTTLVGLNQIKTGAHNLFSRFLYEFEIGDRLDLRTGLGMGVGFIGIDHGVITYSGVGFAYDFLAGIGFRFGENWSLQFDYKYYLSSANDEYDRILSHSIMVALGLDL